MTSRICTLHILRGDRFYVETPERIEYYSKRHTLVFFLDLTKPPPPIIRRGNTEPAIQCKVKSGEMTA